MKSNTAMATLWIALTAMGGAWAQGQVPATGNPPPREGGHRGPPPEALEACKALKAGAACSFTVPERGAMKGQCWAPENRPLACRPADAPKPPGEGPAPKK